MSARRKAKSLPDLRPKVFSLPESPDATGRTFTFPDDQAIAELAKKHAFPEGFDLTPRLTHVWEWWRADHYMGPEPPSSDRKKLLSEIASRAESLFWALERCGIEERRLLSTYAKHEIRLSDIRDSCEELWLAAMIASASIKPGRGGRRRDGPMLNLIARLFRHWVAAHGADAPRITRTDKYSGAFYNFTEDVLALFGVSKTNTALGKAIERAIAALDSAVARGRIPQIASD